MGVRPPQDDDSDPEVIEFGIAALDAHLDDAEVTYPIDGEELIERLGDPAIRVDAGGRTIDLSKALEQTPSREFENERELLNELHPIFESYREETSSKWLSSLRTLVPF